MPWSLPSILYCSAHGSTDRNPHNNTYCCTVGNADLFADSNPDGYAYSSTNGRSHGTHGHAYRRTICDTDCYANHCTVC